ncbi:MAG: hypothetical protein ACKOI2_03990 [Actinomycetota bacterium]
MTIGEFVLLLAVVLLVAGFAALMLALVRVNDSLRVLRGEMEMWRADVAPLIESLRESADDARSAMDEARLDLGRFDRVLGSAEAISGAVEGSARATRVALSTPVIKIAAFATGTSRAAQRLRKPGNGRSRGREA